MSFLTSDKKEYIKIIIKNILPYLNISEFEELLNMLYLVINYLVVRFSIRTSEYENFWYQLRQNSNKDILGIFNLLLPFIDDKEGTYSNHKKIFSLADIKTKQNLQKSNISKSNISKSDISDTSDENKSDTSDENKSNNLIINKYMISNIQYNNPKNISFGIKDIMTNQILLLETIDRISNKLFINWLNIRPLTLESVKAIEAIEAVEFVKYVNSTSSYKQSNLYKTSLKYVKTPVRRTPICMPLFLHFYEKNIYTNDHDSYIIANNKSVDGNNFIAFGHYFVSVDDYEKSKLLVKTNILEWNKLMSNSLKQTYLYLDETPEVKVNESKLLKQKGIGIGDIFNTLYYDLYLGVVKYKWLIYQASFDNSSHDEIYIKKFNENIGISSMYLGINWAELEIKQQDLFIKRWDNFLSKVVLEKETLKINYYYKMLLQIIIFMEKNYPKMKSICHNFNYIKLSTISTFNNVDDDDIDGEDDDIEIEKEDNIIKMDEIKLVNHIRPIPYEDLYQYFMDTIQNFMLTFYGINIILKFDETNFNDINLNKPGQVISDVNFGELPNIKFNYGSYFSKYIKSDVLADKGIIFPENLTVKYKFIYNFAKAFGYILGQNDDKSIKVLKTNWHNMSSFEREIMLNNLNFTHQGAKQNNYKEKYANKCLNVLSFTKYYKMIYYNNSASHLNIITNDPKNPIKKVERLFDEGYYNEVSILPDRFIKGLGDWVGNQMYEFIREKLIDIVFECLIYKGILGEFICDSSISDYNLIGSTYDEKKRNQFINLSKSIKSKQTEYENNSNYFLTNRPYIEMPKINLNGKICTYFDLLKTDYRWYTFYSMDWISQINFFHKYINNRVIYVTGSTGQGKSTQIPKLFLYALKMLDYNSNGKIICSQPRIKPTKENSERIAYELGLPIIQTTLLNGQQVTTSNSAVQYRTKEFKHIVKKPGLSLTVVTDKLLYMELIKNALFKSIQESHDANTTGDTIEYNVYRGENLYDIIIVDESHEHSVNMDLILTMGRDTIQYNNSLKLIIVSATMTDDEPLYRRYYKEINDNFSHPYNFYNAEYNLDRMCTDRRIHISPPGETTQHKVMDIYLETDCETYADAEKIAIEKALDLAKTTTSGDILFFSLGTAEIIKICTYINKQLPADSNIICLPAYRGLGNWDLTDNLSQKIKKITINRTSLFDAINSNLKPNDVSSNIPRVNLGTYTRAIIVATNIAEASITIDSLKYIIDTGYNISVSYDVMHDKTNVENKKISEQSRLQRRGRVGRVSSGTVYYMYIEEGRKHIKSDYEMTKKKITLELWDLCAVRGEDYLFGQYDWPTFINREMKNLNEELEEIQNNPLIKSNIFKYLINSQYSYKNHILPSIINLTCKLISNLDSLKKTFIELNSTKIKNIGYKCAFNSTQTYDIMADRIPRFITGYDIVNHIFDKEGLFYIIHPEETKFRRSTLTGQILNISQIELNIIEKYVNDCFDLNLFIDNSISKYMLFDKYDITNHKYNMINEYNIMNYEKTSISRIINQLINDFNILGDDTYITMSFIQTIIYSFVVDSANSNSANSNTILNIVLMMISLLIVSNYNISQISPYKSKSSNYLFEFYTFANELVQKIAKFNMTISDNMQKFVDERNLYLTEKKRTNEHWDIIINSDLWNRLNELSNTNKLNLNKNTHDYMSESINIPKDLENNFSDILQSLSINVDLINPIKILKIYLSLMTSVYKLQNLYNLPNTTNVFAWFKYNLPVRVKADKFENITRAFIYGFGNTRTIIYKPKFNTWSNIHYLATSILMTDQPIISEFGIYLFEEKQKIHVIIPADLETIAELNLYNFSPSYVYKITKSALIAKSNSFGKFAEKIYEIYKSKYRYIGHLLTHDFMHLETEKMTGLLALPNNHIQYLIKLMTTNMIGGIGGIGKIGKIKISSIIKALKKLKISNIELCYLINKLIIENNLYIDKLYIYLFIEK